LRRTSTLGDGRLTHIDSPPSPPKHAFLRGPAALPGGKVPLDARRAKLLGKVPAQPHCWLQFALIEQPKFEVPIQSKVKAANLAPTAPLGVETQGGGWRCHPQGPDRLWLIFMP